MYHHREGSGAPLVLIHGVGHHWQAWRPVIDRLAGEFDMLATDTSGFGDSAPLPDGVEPNLANHVDAFERFFKDQGLDRPHVAGNSMGGGIALELARRGSVRSVTALSPVGFASPGEWRYAKGSLLALTALPGPVRRAISTIAATPSGRKALFAQLIARPGSVPTEEAMTTLADLWAAAPVFDATVKALASYEFTAGHELTGTPVTIAWGDKDRLLLYRNQSARARAALPHARHIALDAGHLPFYDAPDAVAQAIRSTAAAA